MIYLICNQTKSMEVIYTFMLPKKEQPTCTAVTANTDSHYSVQRFAKPVLYTVYFGYRFETMTLITILNPLNSLL